MPAPDKLDVVAVLFILAKNNLLEDLLKEDNRFYRLVEQELVRRGAKSQLNDFKVYPSSPRSTQLFLEVLLEARLRLAESEAARFGLHLANLAKQAGNDKYGKIAYYDLSVGQFKWQK